MPQTRRALAALKKRPAPEAVVEPEVPQENQIVASNSNARNVRPRRSQRASNPNVLETQQKTEDNARSALPSDLKPCEETEEIVLEDGLTCPICHDLVVKPVSPTTCNHAACELCFTRLFTVRSDGEPGIPPSQRTRPCPLCRQTISSPTDLVPLHDLDDRAKATHPLLYTRRLIETALAKQHLAATQPSYFTLKIGNSTDFHSMRTRRATTARHSWRFFMALQDADTTTDVSDSTIAYITLQLPDGERIDVTEAPFEISRSGMGSDRDLVCAAVHFKPETGLHPVAVTWLLNMCEGNHSLDVPLELSRGEERSSDGGGSGGGSGGGAGDGGAHIQMHRSDGAPSSGPLFFPGAMARLMRAFLRFDVALHAAFPARIDVHENDGSGSE